MRRMLLFLGISDLLTEETKKSFDPPIGSIKLMLNVKYGPFYRIDTGKMAEGFPEKPKFPLKDLKPNLNHLIKYRTDQLKKYCISSLNKDLAEAFLIHHRDEIEMDPSFSLLKSFQLLFPKKCKQKIEKEWYKKSPSRWGGLDKPKNFLDGHKKYCLGHLLPKELDGMKKLFLFRFILRWDTSDRQKLDPEIFFGKTYGGTAVQYKLNNDAVECIRKLSCLEDFSIKVVSRG